MAQEVSDVTGTSLASYPHPTSCGGNTPMGILNRRRHENSVELNLWQSGVCTPHILGSLKLQQTEIAFPSSHAASCWKLSWFVRHLRALVRVHGRAPVTRRAPATRQWVPRVPSFVLCNACKQVIVRLRHMAQLPASSP